MKKIHSERYVNKQGLIPFIYKQNINGFIDRVNRLENNMITDSISYGIVKSYTDWDLWFEAITDTVDGFVMRNHDGSIISVFQEQGGGVNYGETKSNILHRCRNKC